MSYPTFNSTVSVFPVQGSNSPLVRPRAFYVEHRLPSDHGSRSSKRNYYYCCLCVLNGSKRRYGSLIPLVQSLQNYINQFAHYDYLGHHPIYSSPLLRATGGTACTTLLWNTRAKFTTRLFCGEFSAICILFHFHRRVISRWMKSHEIKGIHASKRHQTAGLVSIVVM